ncbi:hypothetical protein SEVIR_4G041804v4 [Setaria viridis]
MRLQQCCTQTLGARASGPGYEGHDALHEPLGVLALGLHQEEDVAQPLGLEPRRAPGPRAGRRGVVVRAVSRHQPVLRRRAHQQPLAPEALQPRCRARRRRVDPRVVRAAGRVGARERPHLRRDHHRALRLPLDGHDPPEERVEQDRALDPRRVVRGRRPHQHVVHDVAARAVAVLGEPVVVPRRCRPPERGPAVVVGRG